MKSPRFWIVILLLTSTIFVLESRGDVDQVPVSESLSQHASELWLLDLKRHSPHR